MQTFVPYASFEATARVLDTKRLGKQRVEALQIVRALTRPSYGWQNHPAVLMWKGHEEALGSYAMVICEAWTGRGFADTCETKILDDLREAGVRAPRPEHELAGAGALPAWWGAEEVHRSHRSALLRKDPEHYRRHFPGERDDLEYVWPVTSADLKRRRSGDGIDGTEGAGGTRPSH